MDNDIATQTEAPVDATSMERAADKQLIDDLMDRIDGLTSDLENAVEVAVSRGALNWARLNYPGHPALKTDSKELSRAEAAGLSALSAALSEHDLAVKAADKHLLGDPAPGGFHDMSVEEVEDFRAFHARAAAHMRDYIKSFQTTDQDQVKSLREVALAEREACMKAVGVACAPVVGTPYITGPRKFCEAIRNMPDVNQTSVQAVLDKK
jgi:hypothetical protein